MHSEVTQHEYFCADLAVMALQKASIRSTKAFEIPGTQPSGATPSPIIFLFSY